MNIRCLIVDDEPLAILILENYIEKIQSLELIGSCRSAIEAYNILQTEKIDLLFLDIEMPKLTGINLIKNLQNPPQVIFTTAYRDFAVESYELNALDYLIKPISFERFLKAVHRFPTHSEVNPASEDSFIYLKAEKKVFKVLVKEIIFIESLKDYIIVHTNQQKIITYQNISHIEQTLPIQKFLRIHRSFIVNLDYLQAFNTTSIFLNNQQELPIGRSYKDQVVQRLHVS